MSIVDCRWGLENRHAAHQPVQVVSQVGPQGRQRHRIPQKLFGKEFLGRARLLGLPVSDSERDGYLSVIRSTGLCRKCPESETGQQKHLLEQMVSQARRLSGDSLRVKRFIL